MSRRSTILMYTMMALLAVCALFLLWVIVAIVMIAFGWLSKPVPFAWPWLPVTTIAYLVVKRVAGWSIRRDEAAH